MQGTSDRTFAIAVAASVLAHALVLLAIPGLLDPVRKRLSAAPIVAHLVPTRPAPEPPPVVEARREPKTPETPRPARQPPVDRSNRPAATAQTTTAPVIQSPTPPEAPRIAAPIPPAPVPPKPSSAATKPEPTAPPVAAVPGEASDPLTLGQYRIAIIAAAKRYKKYPRIAIDNNWEGQAEVRMEIGADGAVGSIRIKVSSGFDSLDQQALEMIRKAKPLAPIPAALRGKGFTVDVPVLFSLKDETG
jgi:protein TonB